METMTAVKPRALMTRPMALIARESRWNLDRDSRAGSLVGLAGSPLGEGGFAEAGAAAPPGGCGSAPVWGLFAGGSVAASIRASLPGPAEQTDRRFPHYPPTPRSSA